MCSMPSLHESLMLQRRLKEQTAFNRTLPCRLLLLQLLLALALWFSHYSIPSSAICSSLTTIAALILACLILEAAIRILPRLTQCVDLILTLLLFVVPCESGAFCRNSANDVLALGYILGQITRSYRRALTFCLPFYVSGVWNNASVLQIGTYISGCVYFFARSVANDPRRIPRCHISLGSEHSG